MGKKTEEEKETEKPPIGTADATTNNNPTNSGGDVLIDLRNRDVKELEKEFGNLTKPKAMMLYQQNKISMNEYEKTTNCLAPAEEQITVCRFCHHPKNSPSKDFPDCRCSCHR